MIKSKTTVITQNGEQKHIFLDITERRYFKKEGTDMISLTLQYLIGERKGKTENLEYVLSDFKENMNTISLKYNLDINNKNSEGIVINTLPYLLLEFKLKDFLKNGNTFFGIAPEDWEIVD